MFSVYKRHNNELYNNLVKLSRNIFFYKNIKLGDKFETRVLLIFFHFAIILRHFKKNLKKDFPQKIYDNIFLNIEYHLRELGYGDVSVNKQMKILNKIFGGALEKVSDVVDKFVMTKEEKHAARVEIEKIFIEAENETQRNVTERWKADASSDSWLSKNIRPLVLLFLIISTVIIIFIDSGQLQFTVAESWVDLLQITLITVIGAYFGGRSVEKFQSISKK